MSADGPRPHEGHPLRWESNESYNRVEDSSSNRTSRARSPGIPHAGSNAVDRHRKGGPQAVVGRGRAAQAAQQLHLQQVDRVDVRVAHGNRSLQDAVRREQLAVPGRRAAAARWRAARPARSWSPIGRRSRWHQRAVVLGGDAAGRPWPAPSPSGRATPGSRASLRTSRAGVLGPLGLRSRWSSAASRPSHDARSSRVCVQANCQGIARSDPTPAPGDRRAGRLPMLSRPISTSGVAARKYSTNRG